MNEVVIPNEILMIVGQKEIELFFAKQQINALTAKIKELENAKPADTPTPD